MCLEMLILSGNLSLLSNKSMTMHKELTTKNTCEEEKTILSRNMINLTFLSIYKRFCNAVN